MIEPTHPAPSALAEPPQRRNFLLTFLLVVFGGLATVFLAIPLVGYLAGALRRPSKLWVTLDAPDQYPVNETRLATFVNPLRQPWDGMTANTGAYVRNMGKDAQGKDQFLVFAINCTHLGCPVSWFPQSGLFMCPCHGGVYYEDGQHASGPPPRGLYHCPWRIRDGKLEIMAPFLPTLQDTLMDESKKA